MVCGGAFQLLCLVIAAVEDRLIWFTAGWAELISCGWVCDQRDRNPNRSGYEFEQPRKAHRAEMFHLAGRSQRNRGCFGESKPTKVGAGAQIRSEQAGVAPGPGAQVRSQQASVASGPRAQIRSEQAGLAPGVTLGAWARISTEQAGVPPGSVARICCEASVTRGSGRTPRACGNKRTWSGWWAKRDNRAFSGRRA